ncbi:hypothetical protein Agabi119p4_2221 [Agaricus bisporus var. burnettii]|uniref:BTB domain-containing protein n=1 Tax=Agaricus bisporus var. burnettii TaxID=192524 RepID=A0A8H7F8X4_AGABI|nr:hypothetical protein Agabi119p4_2221 [Agaricus bisporus var. burnettii]
MTETQRDPNFYFSFRTFQVEDTLFRVPRHLFLMPKADIKPVRQGTDNEDDLVELGEEIKKDDFLQLLRAVYPRHYNEPEDLSSHQWQTVLRLSKLFQLDEVRQKAARNLKNIFFDGDLVEALLCAKENKLEDWIEPLVDKIVSQERELSDEESERVGTKIAMKIARAQGAAEAKKKRRVGNR